MDLARGVEALDLGYSPWACSGLARPEVLRAPGDHGRGERGAELFCEFQ